MNPVTHKSNAEDYLRSAKTITGELQQEGAQGTGLGTRERWLAEATLYLAEQQLAANLMTFVGDGPLSPIPEIHDEQVALKRRVTEALDLS